MGVRAIVKTGSLVATLLLGAALPGDGAGSGCDSRHGDRRIGRRAARCFGCPTAAQGGLGSNQEAITDARAMPSRLQPGTYSVRAELAGFRARPAERRRERRRDRARDLKLQIGVIEEAITVTSATPLLDTTSALKQTVPREKSSRRCPTAPMCGRWRA